jgi:transcriptional/translational regulatory protein YebC/TACO1
MIPSTTVRISGEHAELLSELIDALEDNDDVQKVYTNAESPEEADANSAQ